MGLDLVYSVFDVCVVLTVAILIGCEESQTICGAFRRAGFDAFSCDILPTRGNPDWHYQANILEIIPIQRWDLIILHPDCTALALCGNSTYGRSMEKHEDRKAAISWTRRLWDLATNNAERVALENPASVIFQYLDFGQTQFVQPYMFGHMEQKKTGLRLFNLPTLAETDNVYIEMMKLTRAERERVHYMSPGPNRKRDRSKTFDGIADAIVSQWGPIL